MNQKSQGFNITHIYSLWQDLSVDTNIFDLVTLTLTLTYFWKNLEFVAAGVLVPLRQTPIKLGPSYVQEQAKSSDIEQKRPFGYHK